jgi:hypothetical protein
LLDDVFDANGARGGGNMVGGGHGAPYFARLNSRPLMMVVAMGAL